MVVPEGERRASLTPVTGFRTVRLGGTPIGGGGVAILFLLTGCATTPLPRALSLDHPRVGVVELRVTAPIRRLSSIRLGAEGLGREEEAARLQAALRQVQDRRAPGAPRDYFFLAEIHNGIGALSDACSMAMLGLDDPFLAPHRLAAVAGRHIRLRKFDGWPTDSSFRPGPATRPSKNP